MVDFLRGQNAELPMELLIRLLPQIGRAAPKARIIQRVHHRLGRDVGCEIPQRLLPVLRQRCAEHMPEQTMHQHVKISPVDAKRLLEIGLRKKGRIEPDRRRIRADHMCR